MDKVYLFFPPLTVSSGAEYCFNARTKKHKTCNYPAGLSQVFLQYAFLAYFNAQTNITNFRAEFCLGIEGLGKA